MFKTGDLATYEQTTMVTMSFQHDHCLETSNKCNLMPQSIKCSERYHPHCRPEKFLHKSATIRHTEVK
eukprot:379395-Amphidinium_carterae.1